MKRWVTKLSWDFLVTTLTHPSKDMHIATLFRALVNDVGDKFGFAPTGLGFRHREAPELWNGTKRQGRPYHVFTSVIRVVDAQYSLTPCVGSSPASASLPGSHALIG